MVKNIIKFLLGSMLICFAASVLAQSMSFADYVHNNPGYFSVGFGTSVTAGSASHFTASTTGVGATATHMGVEGDVASSMSGGYHFARFPLRMGFGFVSMLDNVNPSSSAVTSLGDGSLIERIYALEGLYDYAFTPHWIASIGAGVGVANFSFNAGSSNSIVEIRNQYGVAYQGIVELMYRWTGLSLGVSDHFIGTSVSVHNIFPSAHNSHAVLSNYIGFTGGIMFW
jgi:hypothetical protein